eukprot:8102725-Ditylum_brightwellii.AAC.1
MQVPRVEKSNSPNSICSKADRNRLPVRYIPAIPSTKRAIKLYLKAQRHNKFTILSEHQGSNQGSIVRI